LPPWSPLYKIIVSCLIKSRQAYYLKSCIGIFTSCIFRSSLPVYPISLISYSLIFKFSSWDGISPLSSQATKIESVCVVFGFSCYPLILGALCQSWWSSSTPSGGACEISFNVCFSFLFSFIYFLISLLYSLI